MGDGFISAAVFVSRRPSSAPNGANFHRRGAQGHLLRTSGAGMPGEKTEGGASTPMNARIERAQNGPLNERSVPPLSRIPRQLEREANGARSETRSLKIRVEPRPITALPARFQVDK